VDAEFARDDRPVDDRPMGDRPEDEKPVDDRPMDDRPEDDRPRDKRAQERGTGPGKGRDLLDKDEMLSLLLPDSRSTASLEIRYGSTYLQSIGVLLLSVTFIVLGLSPSSLLPEWAQVLLIFVASGIMLAFGEHLFRKPGTALFGKGLVFGGIKIVYSGIWSLFFHFELIGLTEFSLVLVLMLISHFALSFRYASELMHSSATLMSMAFLSILFDADIFGQRQFMVLLMAASTGSLIFAFYRDSPTVMLASGVFTASWLVFHAAGNGMEMFQVAFRPVTREVALDAAATFYVILYTVSTYIYRKRGWLIGMFLEERWPLRFRDLSLLATLLSSALIFVVTFSAGAPAVLMMSVAIFMVMNFYFMDRGIIGPEFFSRPYAAGVFCTVIVFGIVMGFPILALAVSLWAVLAVETVHGYRQLEDLLVYLALMSTAVVLTAAMLYGFLDTVAFSVAATVLVLFIAFVAWKRESVDFSTGMNLSVLVWLAAVFALGSSMERIGSSGTSDALVGPFLAALAFDILVVWRYSLSGYFLNRYMKRVGHEFTDTVLRWKVLSPFNLGLACAGVALVFLVRGLGDWGGVILFPVYALSFAGVYFALNERTGRLAMPLLLHLFCFLTAISSPSSLVLLATLFSITAAQLAFSSHRFDTHLVIAILIAAAYLPFFSPAPGLSRSAAVPVSWIFFGASAGLYFVFLPRFRYHLVMVVIIIVELFGLYASLQDERYAEEGLFVGLASIYMVYSLSPWRIDRISDSVHFPFIRASVLILFYSSVPLFYFTGAIDDYTGWYFHMVFSGVSGLHTFIRRRGRLARWSGSTFSPRGSGLHTAMDYSILLSPFPIAMMTISMAMVPYLMIVNVFMAMAFLLYVVAGGQIAPGSRAMHTRTTVDADAFQVILVLASLMMCAQHFLHVVGDVTSEFLSRKPEALALDSAATVLALYYVFAHYIPLPPMNPMGPGDPRSRDGVVDHKGQPEAWDWRFAVSVCLLLVVGSAYVSIILIPLIFFPVSYLKKDLFTNLISLMLMVVVLTGMIDLYMSDLLPALFVFIALAPLFGCLLNESRFLGEPFSYGYATLSTVLMIGTAWLLGDTFETSVIWAVFSGFAVSGGFYFEKRYLRFYGFMMMVLAMIKIGYDWITLSVEERALPMVILAVMMIMSSYFYHLRRPAGASDFPGMVRRP